MCDDVGLSLLDQWRLYREYSPLLGFGQRVIEEPDPYKQAIIVAEACEWLAAKSATKADDKVVRILTDLVRTPAGKQLIQWAIELSKELEK